MNQSALTLRPLKKITAQLCIVIFIFIYATISPIIFYNSLPHSNEIESLCKSNVPHEKMAGALAYIAISENRGFDASTTNFFNNLTKEQLEHPIATVGLAIGHESPCYSAIYN